MGRGKDAQRRADDGDQQRGDAQLERRREIVADVRRHRPPRGIGIAQVAVNQARGVLPELLVERPVEPHLGAHRLVVLDAGLAHRAPRGVRQDAGEDERHHADAEEHQDEAGQAADQVGDHVEEFPHPNPSPVEPERGAC